MSSNYEIDTQLLKADHLIHGDFLDHNVFFSPGGEVSWIFDFEKARMAPRAEELFRSATYSFLSAHFNEHSFNCITTYLDAYLEVYPMRKNELEAGYFFTFFNSVYGLWAYREYFIKGNKVVEEFIEPHFKRIVYLEENKKEFLNYFATK